MQDEIKRILETDMYIDDNGITKKLSDGAKVFLLNRLMQEGELFNWMCIEYENGPKKSSTIQGYVKELFQAKLIEKSYGPVETEERTLPNKLFIRLKKEDKNVTYRHR